MVSNPDAVNGQMVLLITSCLAPTSETAMHFTLSMWVLDTLSASGHFKVVFFTETLTIEDCALTD